MGKEERKGVEETRRGLPVTVETNLSLAVVTYFERHLEKTGQRHSVSPAAQKKQQQQRQRPAKWPKLLRCRETGAGNLQMSSPAGDPSAGSADRQ